MSDVRASDFTETSEAILKAGAEAARGYLMGRGIIMDEDAYYALACVVTKAAIDAKMTADQDMPEPAPELDIGGPSRDLG